MNTILLNPTDVLFFRDGRPMGGSLSGHGAAWPLPHVISTAYHAALHRAQLEGVHKHVPGRSSQTRDYSEENRQKRGRFFGSLVTAGPFPVCEKTGHWYFPRPADGGGKDALTATLHPTRLDGASSLPSLLTLAVGSHVPPSKDTPKNWWSMEAWNSYLNGTKLSAECHFKSDADFADTEHAYGISINPDTGTVEESAFYSTNYLRLREGWRLGTFAEAKDKDFKGKDGNSDLIAALLRGSGGEIVIGGQQRVCSATLTGEKGQPLPLPRGISDDFKGVDGKWRVKWILLTPAIWPEIKEDISKSGEPIHPHTGGWLPNWIALEDQTFEGIAVTKGSVLLLNGPGKEKARRKRIAAGKPIAATLVAAIVGKPIPITGYALPNEDTGTAGGAKSTHLAVPAGAVYYFEARSETDAKHLAAALNWHGSAGEASGAAGPAATSGQRPEPHSTIRNRRSTLMGEKGFGLGVCGTWDFHPPTAAS